MVLPRLKTAYSVLPPMAARWTRAERAMRIIDEIDEKITTCDAAKHICPNFREHRTNRACKKEYGQIFLYHSVIACIVRAQMHIHRHVH